MNIEKKEICRRLREELCRKLRITALERGEKNLNPGIIIAPWDIGSDTVSNYKYLVCPTIGAATLANVDFKTAREFENA